MRSEVKPGFDHQRPQFFLMIRKEFDRSFDIEPLGEAMITPIGEIWFAGTRIIKPVLAKDEIHRHIWVVVVAVDELQLNAADALYRRLPGAPRIKKFPVAMLQYRLHRFGRNLCAI